MPAFPIPTNVIQKAPEYYKISSVGSIRPASRRKSYEETTNSNSVNINVLPDTVAPFPMVSINDAIGDLVSAFILSLRRADDKVFSAGLPLVNSTYYVNVFKFAVLTKDDLGSTRTS